MQRGCSEDSHGSGWGDVLADFFLFVAVCFSRESSVYFAFYYEFVEGGDYLKVRKLDFGGNFFQNIWSPNASCGCLLIFHADPIRVYYVKTEG